MLTLTVIDDSGSEKTCHFSQHSVSVGRSKQSDLCLSSLHVSTHHGEIRRTGGTYRYKDMGSTNGSVIRRKGKEIYIGAGSLTEYSLLDGDEILLGFKPELTVIKLHIEAGPEEKEDSTIAENTIIRALSLESVADRSEQIVKDSRALDELYRFIRSIQPAGRFEDIYKIAATAVLEIFDKASHVVILRAGTQEDTYVPVISRSRKSVDSDLQAPVSQAIVRRVVSAGEAVLFENAREDFKDSESIAQSEVLSGICCPLWHQGKLAGVLQVTSRLDAGLFDNRDLEILSLAGTQLAMKLQNLELIDNLRRAETLLQKENAYLRIEAAREYGFANIIGRSRAMDPVFERMKKAIDTDVTVCIYGETGTGKELVARALHYSGPRRDKKFYPQNCGAVPDTLLTSELFGHKKGAFTGAIEDKKGIFEAAHRGTVFLDEIAETSEVMQASLLRVLQEREIKRVGAQEYKPVDIRLVVATSKDLRAAVQEGTFREDLFFRVNVFSIHLPPLRERHEDIVILANHFFSQYRERHKKPVHRIHPEVLDILRDYSYPGNVRELENIIETAVVMSTGEEIGRKDLPLEFQNGSFEKSPEAVPRTNEALKLEKKRMGEELEKQFLIHALKRHGGKVVDAARETGMNRAMFHRMISSYNIDPREYR